MYDMSETSHIEALQVEPNWDVHKRDKNILLGENEKIAPKWVPPEAMTNYLAIWDKATVHRNNRRTS